MISVVGLDYVFDNLSDTRIIPLVKTWTIPVINYIVDDIKDYFHHLLYNTVPFLERQ